MGAVPTTTNTAAQTVDQIINGVIYDLVDPVAEAAMVVEFPFLGWPVFNTFFKWLVSWVSGYFYKYLSLKTTISIIIPLQVGSEKNAYTKAEADLRAAHLSGDPNALATATAEFKATASSLIHYDGSASP